jgi:hypothetical protein
MSLTPPPIAIGFVDGHVTVAADGLALDPWAPVTTIVLTSDP